jgi:hypothetical protein
MWNEWGDDGTTMVRYLKSRGRGRHLGRVGQLWKGAEAASREGETSGGPVVAMGVRTAMGAGLVDG